MIPIYRDLDEARQRVLTRRTSTGDYPTPLLDRLATLFGERLTPEQAVARLLADVRQRGDAALREWTQRIDGTAITDLRVPVSQLAEAGASLPADLHAALTTAAERIRAFHQRQPLPNWTTTDLGGTLGQRFVPIARVGVYVPGGTAPLPSSLLMSAIPAQVAGVTDLIVCSPPDRATGEIHPLILAAAHIAGIEHVYRVGGAQAIAAMAYGTDSVPRVNKIVGPGGLFVTLAKQQVYGQVGIDGLFGPTETVVIADEHARPHWVAADLLAQAEHDVLATAILLTPSEALATAVQAAVGQQLEQRQRIEILSQSLPGQSGIVLTPDLETALALANDFAPEHLCIDTVNAAELANGVHNAGGIFIGERSFEVLGDYIAGPSHVMPTGGTAHFASPLTVLDFVKVINIIALDEATSAQLSPLAAQMALAEGLDAHAQSARFRADAR